MLLLLNMRSMQSTGLANSPVLTCSLMFIDFTDFVKNPEIVIRSVLDFLGLEQQLFRYEQLPPGMKVKPWPRTAFML